MQDFSFFRSHRRNKKKQSFVHVWHNRYRRQTTVDEMRDAADAAAKIQMLFCAVSDRVRARGTGQATLAYCASTPGRHATVRRLRRTRHPRLRLGRRRRKVRPGFIVFYRAGSRAGAGAGAAETVRHLWPGGYRLLCGGCAAVRITNDWRLDSALFRAAGAQPPPNQITRRPKSWWANSRKEESEEELRFA